MPPWSPRSRAPVGEHSMPSRHDTADLARPSGLVQHRDARARRRPGHEIARRHVAHADHELDLAGRVLEPGEAELVGVRVIADLEDARDDDALEPLPRVQDRLDLDAPVGHRLGELVGGHVGRRELAQPRADDPHADALELLEEPNVAVDEHPHVRDRVAEQRDAFDPHPEGEPRVALGVVPAVLQDLRMHHPGAEQLDPAVAAQRGTRPRRRGSSSPRPPRPAPRTGSTPGPAAPRRSPNSALAIASSVPLRSANVIPSSTTRPSTWWNTGRCVASGVSRR